MIFNLFLVLFGFFIDLSWQTELKDYQKCCDIGKVFIRGRTCRTFEYHGDNKDDIDFDLSVPKLIEFPKCNTSELRPIYNNEYDVIEIQSDGSLRHYVFSKPYNEEEEDDIEDLTHITHYDYKLGTYCYDRKLDTYNNETVLKLFAYVCMPQVKQLWKDTDFIFRKIIDPVLHILAIICYTSIAMIHFVLPQLRDLFGNMITTVSLCMVVEQAAELVGIFTEFSSHISFLIADIIMFISSLSSFFWLSAMGFFIWKTFRSRNVFLRITDGRKYCYYATFVWLSVIIMSFLAIFAHFTLDSPQEYDKIPTPLTQRSGIGWLGMAVFFSPIAFSILTDIYFYVTTVRILKRMVTYGRIHNKLKFCLKMYLKLLIVMVIAWIFLLFSWLPFLEMYYAYIIINGLEAPLFLYIAVFSQERVRVLMKTACCSQKCIFPCCRPTEADTAPEWGEELMAMNRYYNYNIKS